MVGVLSPEIEFGNIAAIDLWLPLKLNADGPRDARNMRFIARLRDGVTFDQAKAELAAIGDALSTEYPLTNGGWKLQLIPIRQLTGGQGFWIVIALFLLSIGLLIAIATANVSNLIMVRAAGRARELAVRTAMGARGGRLLRQFLVEGFLLSAIAAGLAIPTAWAGLQAIVLFNPDPGFNQLRIDLHEVGFVATLTLICPVVFSLASARMIAKPDLRQVLASQGGRGSTATTKGRSVLVVAQVALAVILLTASSLAFKSIQLAFGQPLGMTTDRLLIFAMEFNDAIYPDLPGARAAADTTRDALAAVPGVTRVTAVNALPVLGDQGPTTIVVDEQALPAGAPTPSIVITGARADAAAALGVSLRAGNWWAEGTERSAVISEAAARRYFDGVAAAVGRHFSFAEGDGRAVYQVVGVATDVANTDRTDAPPARVWIPMPPTTRRMTFIVEGRDPATLAADVRRVAAAVAPAVPIENLRTFTEALDRAERERLCDHQRARRLRDRGVATGDERPVWRGVVHRRPTHRRIRHPHGAWCQRVGRDPAGRAAVARVGGDWTDHRPRRWGRRRPDDGKLVVRHLARGSGDAGRGCGAADVGITGRDGTAGVESFADRSGGGASFANSSENTEKYGGHGGYGHGALVLRVLRTPPCPRNDHPTSRTSRRTSRCAVRAPSSPSRTPRPSAS